MEASGGEPAVARAPAVLVFASTFWRNSWKYRDRAYRHCFWDGGTILANCLAAASARDIPARTVMGFADGPVNHLLGLNPDKEAALCLVPVGRTEPATARSAGALPPLDYPTRPLSRREVDYPAIREMHAASNLESGAEARRWREGETDEAATVGTGDAGSPGTEATGAVAGAAESAGSSEVAAGATPANGLPLEIEPAASLPAGSVEQVIVRRGSTRRFSHEPITLAQLSNALHYATRGVATDVDTGGSRPLSQLYLIVNNVDGAAPGTYVLDRGRGSLQLLKEGEFRREAGFLGLGQEIPHDASVNVYFLTDLDPVLRRYGNRGYRLAQMEAAITAGRLYLAAYAQGFGASGPDLLRRRRNRLLLAPRRRQKRHVPDRAGPAAAQVNREQRRGAGWEYGRKCDFAYPSFRRKPESRNSTNRLWIPAFAGMTKAYSDPCFYRLPHASQRWKIFLTVGVSRVRLKASPVCLMASAWVG